MIPPDAELDDIARRTVAGAPAETPPRTATAIERAGYTPDLPVPLPRQARSRQARTPPRQGEPAPGDPGRDPHRQVDRTLIALVHDGRNRDILDAVEAGLGEQLHGGDRLLVLHGLPPGEEAGSLAYFLDRHRPEAVVLMPSLADREDLAALCARAQVGCQRLGSAGSPGCDERRAAASAVRQLIALGHARIGLVAGPDGSASARNRELGYLDAMAEHGLDRGPALIVPGDDTFASGIEAGRLLLEISPRPTAILACNDEMAAGVLHAADQAGVAVPAALSVVGFDDTPLARRTLPTLASVSLPWAHVGQDAARRIVTGQPLPGEGFDAALILRDSLKPLE